MSGVSDNLDYKVSDKLVYKVREYNYPTYKLHRAVAQNGGADIKSTPSGGTESIFELSPEVFNLSRSFIKGRLLIPGGLVSRNTWVYNSQVSLIADIELTNASGVQVCDLKHANNYTDIVSKPETKMSDFLTSNNDILEFLQRNNANLSSSAAARYDGSPPDYSYTEHSYLYWRAATPYVPAIVGPPAFPEVLPVQEPVERAFIIDLKKLKNTILALDKDLFFNEKLFLKIRWAPSTKIYFTSQVNVVANVNSYNVANNPEEAKDDVTLNDVQLYLAYEDNVDIKNAIKSQWSLGMVYRIPYVMSSKISIGPNSTTQNISIPFGPGSGRRLLKIYHALYNSNERSNTAYEHSNINFNRLNQYYTQVNQVKRQQFDVDCKRFEDYLINRDRLKGSVIQNISMYDYNYFILDDFTEDTSIDNNQFAMNYDSGLPITSDLKWDIYCKVDSGMQQIHYTFSIVSKDLYVGPEGMRMK